MNEIVKFKADNGALVEITPDDVVQYFCPTATVQEVGLFLQLCNSQHLDPWRGDAYLIKYGDNPAQIQVGKETFTKRAAKNPDYEGFEAGVTYTDANGHVRQREGSAYYPSAGERLVGGWCRVFVKGKKPFFDEVALQEYNTGKSLWKSKPATMIRKVALVHCLREAFPDDFAGLYSEEEMLDRTPTQAAAVEVEQVADVAPKLAVAKDCEEIGNQINELAELRGVKYQTVYDAVFASKALRAAGFNENGDLTDQQAKAALKLLDAWLASAREQAAKEVPVDVDPDTGEIADEYEID